MRGSWRQGQAGAEGRAARRAGAGLGALLKGPEGLGGSLCGLQGPHSACRPGWGRPWYSGPVQKASFYCSACTPSQCWDSSPTLGRPCRALDAAAKAKLWPLLGRRFKKTQWRRPRSGMAEVRWDERYELLHLPRGTKPRPLGDSKELSLIEVAELYEDSVRRRAGERAAGFDTWADGLASATAGGMGRCREAAPHWCMPAALQTLFYRRMRAPQAAPPPPPAARRTCLWRCRATSSTRWCASSSWA